MKEDKRIRVAQIVGNAENGGVEAMIMNFYRFIDHSRFVFDFFMHGNSSIVNKDEIEKYGGKVIEIPSIKRIFKYKKVLSQYFKQNQYDIIHSNINTTNFVPLGIAKRAGIKVRIAHSHSTSNKKEHIRNLIKNILRPFSKINATHFFTCSEKAGIWLFGKRLYNSGNVKLISNGIDLDNFSFNKEIRNKVRNELGFKNGEFVVGHVGRFKKQKNHEFLIKIFAELQKMNSNTGLILLGEGKRETMIKETVEKEKLCNVIFLGAVLNPFDYYNAMDCFVLPSLYEGFPVVGVEAQANGLKTFFSTDVTNEAKLLESTEYLSLKDGPQVWAQHINNFINQNRVDRSNLQLSNQFDIKSICNNIGSYYIEFINQQNDR